MGQTPEISVGMPVFNGEGYVRQAVESILGQTFGNFELIISDNASTDGTPEICETLAREDRRIRFIRNPENLGAARNFNLVFERSTAPYFRWANADDLSGPTLHERCFAALEENRDAVLAYGKTVLVDGDGCRIADYEDNLDLRHESPAQRFRIFFDRIGLTNVVFGLMRAQAMRNGPLMGDGSIPAGDVLFMALLALEGKFLELPEELFFRRIHASSSSRDRGDENLQQTHWSAGRRPWVKPTWNTDRALLTGVARARVSRVEKARLVSYVLRRMYWHRDAIREELWAGD